VSTELRGVRGDGSEFPLEASVSHGEAAGRKFSTIVVRDITERKRAEAALRDSEERFAAFMNYSPAISFIKDDQGRYVYVSDTCERHLGWPGRTPTRQDRWGVVAGAGGGGAARARPWRRWRRTNRSKSRRRCRPAPAR